MKPHCVYRSLVLIGVATLCTNGLAPLLAQQGTIVPQYVPDRVVMVSQPVTATVDLSNNLPIVPVMINNSGPFRMVIDSTARATVLDVSVVRKARLKAKGKTKLDDKRWSPTGYADVVSMKSLKIGDVTFTNLDAVSVDLDKLYAGERDRDGTLSLAVFARGLLSFDYANGQIVIETGELAFDDGETVLPYSDSAHGPAIKLLIHKLELQAVIGTAYPGVCALTPALQRDVELGYEPASGTSNFGVISDMEVRIPTIKNLVSIGTHDLMTVPVRFDSEYSVIGHDILKHFVVTFDQTNHRVQFLREDDYPVNLSHRPRYGVDMIRQGGSLRIIGIFPNSPVDQSRVIKLGEKIIAINGRRVARITNEALQTLLREEDVITFTVSRSGLPLLVPIQALRK